VPAKTANRALAAPALRHIVAQTVLLLDKKLHQILEIAEVAGSGWLDKCDTHFGVGSPYRTTRAPNAVEHDIEAHGNSIRRGKLQTRARIRKVSNGTIQLWCFVAKDDMRGLQDAFAEGGSFFWHGWKPRIENGLGDLGSRRKSTGQLYRAHKTEVGTLSWVPLKWIFRQVPRSLRSSAQFPVQAF
jgi:hypothetical protein